MTDREFVTALSNSVVNNVATKYSSQPQYHEGWKNRYRNELKDCLVYIAEDEAAAAATPVQPLNLRRLPRRRLIRMTTRATMPTMTGWMAPSTGADG